MTVYVVRYRNDLGILKTHSTEYNKATAQMIADSLSSEIEVFIDVYEKKERISVVKAPRRLIREMRKLSSW